MRPWRLRLPTRKHGQCPLGAGYARPIATAGRERKFEETSRMSGDFGEGVGHPPVAPAVEAQRLPRRLRKIFALEDLEPEARRLLPRPIFGYVAGAAETNASLVPIPMKPPLCSEMIAPPDSGMISPPVSMGSAGRICCQFVRVSCQAFRGRFRRRLSPLRSMRWALWTRRSRMASA